MQQALTAGKANHAGEGMACWWGVPTTAHLLFTTEA